MQRIFDQAAKQAVAMSRVITFASRDPEEKLYDGMSWGTPFLGGSSEFEKNGYRNLEARRCITTTPS
jgi:hypothetical protein